MNNNKEQEKEEKCDSGNIVYTSHPAQYKCIKCGKFWFEYEQTPICSTRNVLLPEEKLSIESWEKGYMEYEDVKEIKEFIKQKLSSHNARLIERVLKGEMRTMGVTEYGDDKNGRYFHEDDILQIIKEEQL